jgi:hypothetical protein
VLPPAGQHLFARTEVLPRTRPLRCFAATVLPRLRQPLVRSYSVLPSARRPLVRSDEVTPPARQPLFPRAGALPRARHPRFPRARTTPRSRQRLCHPCHVPPGVRQPLSVTSERLPCRGHPLSCSSQVLPAQRSWSWLARRGHGRCRMASRSRYNVEDRASPRPVDSAPSGRLREGSRHPRGEADGAVPRHGQWVERAARSVERVARRRR